MEIKQQMQIKMKHDDKAQATLFNPETKTMQNPNPRGT